MSVDIKRLNNDETNELPQTTGVEIMKRIAAGRPWWTLTPRRIERWTASLHPAAMERRDGCLACIGEQWDGETAIELNGVVVTPERISRMLVNIRRAIGPLKAPNGKTPKVISVRKCAPAPGHGTDMLVVDIDVGGFILPASIASHDVVRQGALNRSIAFEVVGLVLAVLKSHDRILRREARIREVAKQAVARIGSGAATLWLRMVPYPVRENPKYLTSAPHTLLLVTLDASLAWSPSGETRLWTLREVRSLHTSRARVHRQRAAMLARLRVAGSTAMIGEAAMAVMQQGGFDPAAVVEQTMGARRAAQDQGVKYNTGSCEATLRYEDGVVNASFSFDGGLYTAGRLTLFGRYPDTIMTSIKGKPFGDIVGHCILSAVKSLTTLIEQRGDAVEIHHHVRNFALGQVGRSIEQSVRHPDSDPRDGIAGIRYSIAA